VLACQPHSPVPACLACRPIVALPAPGPVPAYRVRPPHSCRVMTGRDRSADSCCPMLETAAGFAVLSALTPTALLAGAVYLGSARPRRAMLLYLAGAITIAVIMGIVVLVALRAGGLSLPANRQPRYGLRLGLGVL